MKMTFPRLIILLALLAMLVPSCACAITGQELATLKEGLFRANLGIYTVYETCPTPRRWRQTASCCSAEKTPFPSLTSRKFAR